jgi:hypothetical protein
LRPASASKLPASADGRTFSALIEQDLHEEAENVKAMLTAFDRLHDL